MKKCRWKSIYTTQNQNYLKVSTTPENFTDGWVVLLQDFVAEIFGFKIFADISTNVCL